MKILNTTMLSVGAAAVIALGACAKTESAADSSTRNAKSSVSTNDNGSVSRLFTESTVTTNGNMATEHRRETRTNMDMDGNVLETSTSEYAQTYPVGDFGVRPLSALGGREGSKAQASDSADSFLGLGFGSVFASTNFVKDASEPEFLRSKFTPAKPLDGFDDYYVYVTPKSRKVAKVYACAKNVIEPGARWRRHYLLEALEKRYGTWARLCSYRRPCYTFDIGGSRHVTACLDGASGDYRTVLVAWDDEIVDLASRELEERREEARKSAAEKRSRRVSAAAEAF
jgi:hypothetical protein